MATAKKPQRAAASATKKAAAKPAAAKTKAAPAKTAAAKPAGTTLKPIKETFTKVGLAQHLAEQTGVETKAVKAVMAALELTILASVHKRGVREFTLPGLLKIGVQDVPAKKKRRGIDPFTGEEREFAAKPATVRIKVRALKKIKDAAL
ncbi:MAG: HU family DNA-binding protein [Lautropia sp.]|nr:HU family DNA-binding protein [Lautropia sp.]